MLTSHGARGHLRRAQRRPSGVIFVTQLLDPADPVLGFLVDLLRSVANRCDRLLVIANEVRAVPEDLDADVESLGKERGDGRLTRTLRYERLLMRLSRDRSFSGLFAHMSPIYACLASPVLRPRGMRVVLWFAHPADSWQLALAERLSSVVLTSLPGAYPRRTTKVIAVGQAVNTSRWHLVPPLKPGPVLRVAALGRTSPVKGYPVVIRAVKRACDRGLRIRLRLVGPATTADEVRHREELTRLVEHLGLEDTVEMLGGVPPHAVPEIVAEADVVVNATQAGSGDKTVFEAMASGRLVLVSNSAFADLLSDLPVELAFPNGDVEALAGRLTEVAAMSVHEREAAGRQLRERVLRGHSLSSWTEAVVGAVTGTTSGRNAEGMQ
jgi:glycosyltransferase involved in cell wall biosynthesis